MEIVLYLTCDVIRCCFSLDFIPTPKVIMEDRTNHQEIPKILHQLRYIVFLFFFLLYRNINELFIMGKKSRFIPQYELCRYMFQKIPWEQKHCHQL